MPSKSRKSEMMYREARRTRKHSDGCTFCSFVDKSHSNEIVKIFNNFWLVKNIFPYDVWDDQQVVDHMMVVPKRHIESLADLNSKERPEYADIICDYDKLGYSIYARSFKNALKSIPHQHTHLIKMNDNRIKFMLFIRKPYILLKK